MGIIVLSPSLPPARRIRIKILSVSAAAIPADNGDGAEAVSMLAPSIIEPEPAIPNACKKERLLQYWCS